MASRIQNKILGLGLDAQADIHTASQTYLRFRQLNAELAPSGFLTENDAAEIGKGNEFISASGVYPVSFNPLGRLDKYSSAEFMTYAFAYALGDVTETTGTYTIVPQDPCSQGLELPYFTVIEQVCESGGMALDNDFVGCSMEDVTYDFSYGPGRQSGKITCNWIGSGMIVTPTPVGITIPPVITEHYMLTGSMQLNINGTDYITAKTMLSGQIGWKNNLLTAQGFYPGSGIQDGAAIRGRLEFGVRASTFTFTARLLKNSTEYQKLVNPPAVATAVITVSFDATHTMTFTYPSVQYESVVNSEQDGIVDVTVTVATKFDETANTVVTITSLCGISGIAQVPIITRAGGGGGHHGSHAGHGTKHALAA